MQPKRPVVQYSTVHYAFLPWWWNDAFVHDYDYKLKVNLAMEKAVREVCKEFGVTDDTRLCCQWEGVQVYGDDPAAVKAAGKKLAKTLGRFKHIRFID